MLRDWHLQVEDRAYFELRANQERERAASCENDRVALVHLQLARSYEERARQISELTKLANWRASTTRRVCRIG